MNICIKYCQSKDKEGRGGILKKAIYYFCAFLAGLLNGLLGAGGGMLMVTILSKMGLEQKKAHATSICIILPICLFSALTYINKGIVNINDATGYMIWGILGSVLGAFVLSKINQKILRNIFGIFVIWAAIQLLRR